MAEYLVLSYFLADLVLWRGISFYSVFSAIEKVIPTVANIGRRSCKERVLECILYVVYRMITPTLEMYQVGGVTWLVH